MNSDQLRQLSELLSSTNAINGAKSQLHIVGCMVHDGNGKPIVELGVNENMELVALKIFSDLNGA